MRKNERKIKYIYTVIYNFLYNSEFRIVSAILKIL